MRPFIDFVKERTTSRTFLCEQSSSNWDCNESVLRFGDFTEDGLKRWIVGSREAGISPASINSRITGINAYAKAIISILNSEQVQLRLDPANICDIEVCGCRWRNDLSEQAGKEAFAVRWTAVYKHHEQHTLFSHRLGVEPCSMERARHIGCWMWRRKDHREACEDSRISSWHRSCCRECRRLSSSQ